MSRRFLQHVLPAGFHKVRYYGPPVATRTATCRMFFCVSCSAIAALNTIYDESDFEIASHGAQAADAVGLLALASGPAARRALRIEPPSAPRARFAQ
jgi:hypothetical protein